MLPPLIAHADPLDIPEVGVRMPDVPAGASAVKVTDLLIGDVATFHVGQVNVAIMRLLEPVPAGASVADRRYRSSMREYLVDDLFPTRHEEPTMIAGHEAWSACGAEAQADSGVNWHCVYYLISDQHLYKLSVNAFSSQKPPEFDSAVRALYGISFEPIRSSVGTDGEPVVLPRKPVFKWERGHLSRDWYPAGARSHGSQGVVDVEFSIDGEGRAQDLRVTYATSEDLTGKLGDFLRGLRFRMPSGWEASPSRALRFTLESQFAMQPCHFPADTRVADALVVTVCSSSRAY